MTGVISLELNELSFDLVERYAFALDLKNFKRLVAGHRRYNTIAEAEFSHVEPWIQWVTVHTGLTYDEHGIFRLGDVVHTEYDQIWEKLERELGVTVAAVSPMNAQQSAKRPAFFVPDPWTGTGVTGSWHLRALYSGVREAVNSNAEGKIGIRSLGNLAVGALFNMRLTSIPDYLRLARILPGHKWLKAAVLDYLLTDTFIRQWSKHKPDFASLFLNAGAHIQHHYMYSSVYYDGEHKNPEWYVTPGVDPLEDIYRIYDTLLGRIFELTDKNRVRLLVLTGLSQVPNDESVYYYRPLDHEDLVQRLGVAGVVSVEPRMSRDFLVHFASPGDAAAGERVFESVFADDGRPIFTVDNRGDTLFVKVSYTSEMSKAMGAIVGDRKLADFGALFVHVSIENAIHSNIGTFIDCGATAGDSTETIPLAEVFDHTYAAVAHQQA